MSSFSWDWRSSGMTGSFFSLNACVLEGMVGGRKLAEHYTTPEGPSRSAEPAGSALGGRAAGAQKSLKFLLFCRRQAALAGELDQLVESLVGPEFPADPLQQRG